MTSYYTLHPRARACAHTHTYTHTHTHTNILRVLSVLRLLFEISRYNLKEKISINTTHNFTYQKTLLLSRS